MTEYIIAGAEIHTIDDLYTQFNALLMADADWTLGPSLDGLNDVLYGVDDSENPARFVWRDHEHSRAALGREATREWLEGKLAHPETFNHDFVRRQLDELLGGTGKTYFDLVCEVFADHPGIRLLLH